MRIVLHFLGLRVGGGRTDALNLLYTLPVLAPEHQFIAIVPEDCGYEKVKLHDNCDLQIIPVKPFNDIWRLYFDNVTLKKICKAFKADLLFTMCNNGPLKVGCKHIVMLRRAQFAYQYHELLKANVDVAFKLRFLRWYFQRSLMHADILIVQTETMKSLVKDAYKIKCPICVIGKAVSQNIKTHSLEADYSEQNALVKDNPAEHKFLYLTKYYSHKNLERACEAMKKARDKGANVCLFLTLSLGESEACRQLVERIEKGEFSGAVVNIDVVDLADIKNLYGECSAVFMPTLLESYSATFLEAMAFRKPLLTSDRDFAKEICSDAAIYFDPLSVDSMVDAIEDVVLGKDSVKKAISNSKRQYEKLNASWDTVAKNYLKIFLTEKV